MDTMVPTVVFAAAACAMTGVVAGLIADMCGRRTVALLLVAAGLASGSAAGVWWLSSGPSLPEVGVFIAGGGHTALPSLMYALAAASVVAGVGTLRARERGVAMAALVALGAILSHALLATTDVMVLFVALSGLAVIGYALTAGRGTERSMAAAVRYLVQGVIASGLTVYGLAIVFGLSGGAPDLLAARETLAQAPTAPALAGMALVLAALAFKLGAFPFHSWVPDVYGEADRASVAFLGSVPKVAVVVALLVLVRGTAFASGGFAVASQVVIVLALGSLVFGSFGMLRERSVARLLGYSAIAQVGYALLGVGSGDAGIVATTIFVVTYAVAVAAAFVGLEAIGAQDPRWDGSLAGLAGLGRRAPVTAAAMTAVIMSLTGMPLFAGFWGKLHVILALVGAGRTGVAVVAVLAAVVSFGGYGAVVRAMYFEDAAHEDPAVRSSRTMSGSGYAVSVLVVLAIALVALGVIPLVSGVARVYAVFSL
jgi:NADH-quinone oxidoreductase subunit N